MKYSSFASLCLALVFLAGSTLAHPQIVCKATKPEEWPNNCVLQGISYPEGQAPNSVGWVAETKDKKPARNVAIVIRERKNSNDAKIQFEKVDLDKLVDSNGSVELRNCNWCIEREGDCIEFAGSAYVKEPNIKADFFGESANLNVVLIGCLNQEKSANPKLPYRNFGQAGGKVGIKDCQVQVAQVSLEPANDSVIKTPQGNLIVPFVDCSDEEGNLRFFGTSWVKNNVGMEYAICLDSSYAYYNDGVDEEYFYTRPQSLVEAEENADQANRFLTSSVQFYMKTKCKNPGFGQLSSSQPGIGPSVATVIFRLPQKCKMLKKTENAAVFDPRKDCKEVLAYDDNTVKMYNKFRKDLIVV